MDHTTRVNPIAPDDEYQIICPYCFNMASGGNGEPFSHSQVEFRSETYFSSQSEIEQALGFTEIDIDLASTGAERLAKKTQFDIYQRFLLGTDTKYQSFWDEFEGQTTVQNDRNGRGPTPWEMPIIKKSFLCFN